MSSRFSERTAADPAGRRATSWHRESVEGRHRLERLRAEKAPPRAVNRSSRRLEAPPKFPSWYARSVSVLSAFVESIRRNAECRRAILALDHLDDHTLKDIGISRCQIVEAVHHGEPRD